MRKLLHFAKVTMFIWGSFAFGMVSTIVIHELGHAIAVLQTGGHIIGITLDPLAWSFVEYQGASASSSYITAAGILTEITVGSILLITLWKKKFSFAGMLLLLASFLFLRPGETTMMDIFFLKVGDTVDLIESGYDKNLILIIAVIFLIVGIVSFSYAVPRLGIQPHDSLLKRAAFLSCGILPCFFLLIVRSYFYAPELFSLFILLLVPLTLFILLVAWMSRKFQNQAESLSTIEWRHAVIAGALGLLSITLPYLF